MRRLHLRLLLLPLALPLAVGCDLPRDASGTLDHVRNGAVRVGVVVDTPWVTDSAGVVGGIEGALVTDLARQLGARAVWVRKPESELMLALQKRELDLVIGGLTDALPWKKLVAFTRPYYTDTIVVGVPAGAGAVRDLSGRRVAVEAGSPIAAVLRKKGAMPAVVPTLDRDTGSVAAPSWRLPLLGKGSTGIVLQQERHVLAAPPGENAWLVRIERLLIERKATVPTTLRAMRL